MMRVAAVLSVAALALSGCTFSQGTCSNQPGSFSCGQQVANGNDTKTYTWNNPGTAAQVTWGGQVSSGSFDLQLFDPTGKRVYSHTLQGASQGGFNERSSPGTPGDWQIRLAFHSFTGQMGLTITRG